MVSGFLTKKLKSEKTLGEYLKSARKKRELSFADVEEKTKVRAKYLEAIEKSDWNSLPQDIYVRAFVLSYAKCLGLSRKEVLNLFETELSLYSRNTAKHELAYTNSIKNTKVLITPKLLAYSTLSIFIISLFTYLFFQVAHFAGSPNLKIITPENNTIVESDSLNLKGVTDNGIILTVNDESIPVTNEGSFSLNFKLHRGVNVIKVKAINKTKKESSEILTIEYKPKTAFTDTSINQ